ncbi:MAG TPA: phosphatidylinositol kinase, partial [Candidatus Nanopelagicales bacterium]
VDHGVTFSEDEKLRTVLWGWAGEAVDEDDLADLERLCDELDGPLGDLLSELLTRREMARTKQRVRRQVREAAFPLPGDGWPSLPWPAF